MTERTEVVISAKGEGFDRVQQKTARLAGEAKKILEVQARGFGKMQKGIGATIAAIKSMEKALSSVGTQMERVTKKMGQEIDKQQQKMHKQGAFFQGLAQGAMPGGAGMFFQRGPGMGRQMAGMAVGGMARGVASTPFAGIGGLAQAAGAIPGVGQLLSGQLQSVAALAGQGLGFQRQRLGMAPMLAGGGMKAMAGINAARQSAMEGVAGPKDVEPVQMTYGMKRRAVQKYGVVSNLLVSDRARRYRDQGMGAVEAQQKARVDMKDAQIARWEKFQGDEIKTETQRRSNVSEADYQSRRRKAGGAAAGRYKSRLFGPMQKAGLNLLGVNKQEAMQQAGAILQSGGGNIGQMQQQGMLRTGFAAQTAFGVDSGVSGAFLQAGRRGGISGLTAGTPGGGGDALTSSIADAMKLGLEGSEINDYLRAMADGITQWKQTGMPLAKDAIAGFGQELGKMGMGGVRGSSVAMGMVNAAQGLSRRGPQNASELLMMQTVGGLTPGKGGAAGFEEAQIKLEQLKGGGSGEDMTKFMGQLIKAGGGGAGGRLFARQSMGKMGVNIGAEEFNLMGRQLSGDDLTGKEKKRLSSLTKERQAGAANAPGSSAELQKNANRLLQSFGSGLKTAADVQNRQMRIGVDMIPLLGDLSNAQIAVTEGFNDLAGKSLKSFSEAVKNATEAVTGRNDKTLWESLSDWSPL